MLSKVLTGDFLRHHPRCICGGTGKLPNYRGGPGTSRQAAIQGAAAGVTLAAVVIAMILVTGQTFGQRCAAVYPEPRAQAACVERLNNGERI